MGKKSRLRMLKDKINNFNELRKDVTFKLKMIKDETVTEAKANTENFNEWWRENYPEEYLKTEDEVKSNRNLPYNTALVLRRMNDWRKNL